MELDIRLVQGWGGVYHAVLRPGRRAVVWDVRQFYPHHRAPADIQAVVRDHALGNVVAQPQLNMRSGQGGIGLAEHLVDLPLKLGGGVHQLHHLPD